MSTPESPASFFGKHKIVHIVVAVLTAGLWLLVLLAIYLWRKDRKVPSIITAAALGLLLLFIGIGIAAPADEETADPETITETETVTETTEEQTTEEQTTEEATTQEQTTTEAPEPSFATFGDGQHRVGTDISAGTYRAPDASGCYWARLKNFSGELDAIIANENASGPTLVTIAPSDGGFDSNGCGEWTADLRRITESRTSFGDGKYIVRVDIAPGSYRSVGGSGCYWARLSNFSGELEGIIANDNATGSAIVQIAGSDRGFESNGCGNWSQ